MQVNSYDSSTVPTRIQFSLLAALLLIVVSCRRNEPGMQFVLIPAGKFEMGSHASEPGHRGDETLHRVMISRPFYMSATEVTQEQWTAVMGSNPSHFRGRNLPVESVSWFEVQEFLRLTHCRLPTEAEWEYACRAGSKGSYSVGERLSTDRANYDGRAPKPVASFRANAWGLYDMHGNVWEWCADEYCLYPASEVSDPFEKCGSPYKVIRGGSWYFGADSARSALRYTHEPRLRGFSIGFRVVRDTATFAR